MKKYVALLRGINVGGNKKVPMKDLKMIFEKQGYKNVKTLLASGNVVFEGEHANGGEISKFLEKAFGFTVPTIVLPHDIITDLVKSDPFACIETTPKTKLYVTFLTESGSSNLEIPYREENGSFSVLHRTDHYLTLCLDLDKTGSTEMMKFLEDNFGKSITTRNFNTVLKVAGA